jgi:polysaccharide biosynthesis transport protein
VERDTAFSLQDYVAVLRRQKVLIVVLTVAAAVGGAVWFLAQTPLYEARTELALDRVRAAQDVSLNELLNPTGNVRDQDVAGATSVAVANDAAAALGRSDPSDLRARVRAESVSDNRILRITATDADPVSAARIADAFAEAFIEYRRTEAVDAVLDTQEELDQRAREIRGEIASVDAQIAALAIPEPVVEDEEAAEPPVEDEAPADGAAPAEGEAALEGEGLTEGEVVDEEPEPVREPTAEELEQLETLQIRRNALRTQLSQVIARSTELGESAEALTGFSAEFTPAQVPTTPIGNTIYEVAGVAAILGLALAIALAFVRDHFDDVIRDEEDFKRATGGLPVLGRIPTWKPASGDAERVASMLEPASTAAEAYRELSAGVRFMLVALNDAEEAYDPSEHHGLSRSRVVMVTSASMGEGKTSTACNLAVAAARVGLRTVLVDADLRRPAVARRFGLGKVTGLSDALLNGDPPERHVVDVGLDNLRILPAGTIPPNPAELLASPAMRAMQATLVKSADLVIIDTPAVLAVPDTLEVGPFVDLAVMVGRIGETSRRRIGAALERLDQVGTRVSGTALNDLDPSTDGYYYAYYYAEEPVAKKPRLFGRKRAAAGAEDTEPSPAPAASPAPASPAASDGGSNRRSKSATSGTQGKATESGGLRSVVGVPAKAGREAAPDDDTLFGQR